MIEIFEGKPIQLMFWEAPLHDQSSVHGSEHKSTEQRILPVSLFSSTEIVPGPMPRLSSFFENGRDGKIQPFPRTDEELKRIREVREKLRKEAKGLEI